MRDSLKNIEYFNTCVLELEELIVSIKKVLKENKIDETKVSSVIMRNLKHRLNKCTTEYSMGKDISMIKPSFEGLVRTINDGGWIKQRTKVNIKPELYLDQYKVVPHGRMLRMLSLAYLLNVSDDNFQILVDRIDADNISDKLYEFIIRARVENRPNIRNEEYDKDVSVILKSFNSIREAVSTDDKKAAEKLIVNHLKKDFYHKHAEFYNSHKSRANIYYGYWSFEAAAIVAIMDLDDSSFREHKYYPKDLVDYYRSLKTLS